MNKLLKTAGLAFAVGSMTGCTIGDNHNISLPSTTIPIEVETTAYPLETTPETTQLLPVSTLPETTTAPAPSVQGIGAIFNYAGVTTEEVLQMEHCGNPTDKVLLTFDDTGSSEHIRAIADTLQAQQIGAIFFPNTSNVPQAMFDELRSKGFWVGNHTADHPDLVKLSDQEIRDAIKSGGGATLLRPPYGGYYTKDGISYFDSRIKYAADELGKHICLWTVDPDDWKGIPPEEITNQVLGSVKPSSVVLMHMQDDTHTLEALPGIIEGIRAKGLELCALPAEPTTRDIPAELPC